MNRAHHYHMNHSENVDTRQDDSSYQYNTPVYSHVTHKSHNHIAHDHPAYFNVALNATVFFEKLILDSKPTLFWTCLFTCILAVGYQGTKWFRQYIHRNLNSKIHSIKCRDHLLQTLLYGAEFTVSYLLMLIVMTYNIWLLVVSILGLGLGYWLFGRYRLSSSKLSNDFHNVEEQRTRAFKSSRDQYDRTPSAQELMPLKTDMCASCKKSLNKAVVRCHDTAVDYTEAVVCFDETAVDCIETDVKCSETKGTDILI